MQINRAKRRLLGIFEMQILKRWFSLLLLAIAGLRLVSTSSLTPVGPTSWGAIYGHSYCMLETTLYVIGGARIVGKSARVLTGEVWSSTEYPYNVGTLVNPAMEMGARYFGDTIVVRSGESISMLYLGGSDGVYSLGGVFLSYVGTAWSFLGNPGWGPREQFATFNCLASNCGSYTHMLIGGQKQAPEPDPPFVYYGDVWASIDNGVSWTQIVSTSALPPRYGFSLISTIKGDDTVVYVAGGSNNQFVFSDVWTSSTASMFQSWTQIAVAGTPAGRIGALAFINLDNTIHMIGGTVRELSPLVYNTHDQSSWDGSMWCKPDSTNPLFTQVNNISAVAFAGFVRFGNQILFSGGLMDNALPSDQAYVFDDAKLDCNTNQLQWIYNSSEVPPYTRVCGHTAVYMKEVLYIFGGSTDCTPQGVISDVWNYTLTQGWRRVTHSGTVFTSRYLHGSVYFQGTDCVYIFGGSNGTDSYLADLVQFCNGVFQKITMTIPYEADAGFGYTLNANRIYLVGGMVHNNITYVSIAPFTSWTRSVQLPLQYATSNPVPIVQSDGYVWYTGVGTSLRITTSEFNSGIGSWAVVGPSSAPYDPRSGYALAALAGVNATTVVPTFQPDYSGAALFLSGGRPLVDNFFSYAADATAQLVWNLVSPYPLTTVSNSRGEQANFILTKSAFSTIPSGKAVVVTGGLLASTLNTTNILLTYGPNACLSNPCECGGTCIPNPDIVCQCPDGYSGLTCNIKPDVCASSPCQNGGTCTNSCNGFTCECIPGYYGDWCQFDVCSNLPCQNGGSCYHNGTQGIACHCVSPWTGPTCENLMPSSSTGAHVSSSASESSTGQQPSISSSTGSSNSSTPSSSSSSSTGSVQPLSSTGSHQPSSNSSSSSTGSDVQPSSSSSSSSTGSSPLSSTASQNTTVIVVPTVPTPFTTTSITVATSVGSVSIVGVSLSSLIVLIVL